MSFIDTKSVEEEYNIQTSNTDYFKPAEGDNRFRLLSRPIHMPKHYEKNGYMGICIGKRYGCPGCKRDDELKAKGERATLNVRWLCWVLADGKIQMYEAPHKVIKQLEAILEDPESATAETPMPYDLILNVVNAGKTNVAYALRASRNNSPIAQNILEAYSKLNKPEEIVQKMKDKKIREIGGTVSESTAAFDEINPDEIPL